MGIYVTFACGGCDARAEGTSHVRRNFKGITGRPWGFGRFVEEKASDKAPPGWVAYCPAGGTYCPDCAAEIWPPEPAEEATDA